MKALCCWLCLCEQQPLEAKVPKPTHQDTHIPREQLVPGSVISCKAAHGLGSPPPKWWSPVKVHGCPLDSWDPVLLSSFSLHSLSLDLDPTSAPQPSCAKAVAAPQPPSSHTGTRQWFCRGIFTAASWQPHLPSSGRSCWALVAPSVLALGSGFQLWLYCKESRGLKCSCHLSACNYIL